MSGSSGTTNQNIQAGLANLQAGKVVAQENTGGTTNPQIQQGINNMAAAQSVNQTNQAQTALGQPTTTTTSGVSTPLTSSMSSLATPATSLGTSSQGTLLGSTTQQSKDMRLVIAPANATAAAITAATAQTTSANSNVFSTSSLIARQGGSTTTATPTSTSTGVPTGSGYYTGILAPLIQTNGVLFPYSPTINFTQDVQYDLVGGGLVHTNQDYNAYQRTPSVKLVIGGKFTIQNQYEGLYMLAVIHFFRTVSKMYFGQAAASAGTAGLPPPILILNGYGTYMFNNLPCLLTSHSFDYGENIDTIDVPDLSGGITKLPAILSLTVDLTVQQTPYNMSTQFDLNAFRSGALMKSGGGWI